MYNSSTYNPYAQSCQFKRLAEASREGEREGARVSLKREETSTKGRLRLVGVLQLHRPRVHGSSRGKECQQHLVGKLGGGGRWEFIAIPYLGEGVVSLS